MNAHILADTFAGLLESMAVRTGLKKRAKKGLPHVTRFPGLMEHARALGVNRVHLYLVLSGQRISHRLLHRYNQLKGEGMS
jgi:hypothetical protein